MNHLYIKCPNCFINDMNYVGDSYVCSNCGTEIKGTFEVTIKNLNSKPKIILSKTEFVELFNRLCCWRVDKNISEHTQRITIVDNINEEIEEFYTKGLDENYNIKDKYEFIDALSDMMVILINSTVEVGKYVESGIYMHLSDDGGLRENTSYVFKKDSLRTYWKEITKNGHPKMEDIYEFTKMVINTMYYYNYVPYKVINETILEISDRTQDPIQKKRWDEMRAKGIPIEEKWEKDKDPEVQKTWYKAQYGSSLRWE